MPGKAITYPAQRMSHFSSRYLIIDPSIALLEGRFSQGDINPLTLAWPVFRALPKEYTRSEIRQRALKTSATE